MEIFCVGVIFKFFRFDHPPRVKSSSKLLEKIVKFEGKFEIIPPENIEEITQFSGSRTAVIGHQGIRASKMAFEGLKLRYPNTTAFV